MRPLDWQDPRPFREGDWPTGLKDVISLSLLAVVMIAYAFVRLCCASLKRRLAAVLGLPAVSGMEWHD